MSTGPLTFELPTTISSPYVVFVRLPDAELDAKALAAPWLARFCSDELAELLAAIIESDAVMFVVKERAQLPRVPPLALERPRVGSEERRRFEQATHAVLIHAQWVSLEPPVAALASLTFAYAVAEKLGGVVFATDLPRLLSVEPLTQRFMPEGFGAATFLACPQSQSAGGRAWMTTVGMQRLGLPNLELVDVPTELTEHLLPVLLGAADRLVEEAWRRVREAAEAGQVIGCHAERRFELSRELELSSSALVRAMGVAGAKVRELAAEREGTTTLGLSVPPRAPGLLGRLRGMFGGGRSAPELATVESLLRIGPPASFEGELDEWYHRMLADLVGLEPGVVVQPPDPQALERARERALSEWPPVKERFARGLARPQRLYVKRGFPVAEGLEYMWIAVTELEAGKVTGTLSNDSVHDEKLRAGKRVSFPEAELFDWMISTGDSYEGGYTIAALSAGKA